MRTIVKQRRSLLYWGAALLAASLLAVLRLVAV
jgi:hypothetical protein